MYIAKYIPTTENEVIIRDLLVQNGVKERDIEFKGSFGDRYVRIGYWNRLSDAVVTELELFVDEDSFEDDDTGTGFLYKIKTA